MARYSYGNPNLADSEHYIPVEKVQDVQIYLQKSTGKFVAEIGKDLITRKDLASVRGEINSRTKGSVPVMRRPSTFGHYQNNGYGTRRGNMVQVGKLYYDLKTYEIPEVSEIVQATGSQFRMRSGELSGHYEGYCLPNPEVFEELRKLSWVMGKTRVAYEAAWDVILESLPRLSEAQVKELLAQSREQAEPEQEPKEKRNGKPPKRVDELADVTPATLDEALGL